MKDRKRTAVRPKRSRAPTAVLNCKSFHTSSSNLNGKGSDYATPLDKLKYKSWTGSEEWEKGQELYEDRSSCFPMFGNMDKSFWQFTKLKTSTSIYKYKVPGTQPSQPVIQFKVLKLFIHHHLAY